MIYDHNDQVLVLQRKDDPEFWQSVTGTIETDELPIETAIREVHEETGIDIMHQGFDMVDTRVVNQFEIRPEWRFKYPPGEYVNTEYVFTVCVKSDLPVVLTEHIEYIWLSPEKAMEQVWSQSNRDAIERHFFSVDSPNSLHDTRSN